MIRRPCWCTKQWQIMVHVLHNNRVKFPKDYFSFVLWTSMATMTSGENHLLEIFPLHEEDWKLVSCDWWALFLSFPLPQLHLRLRPNISYQIISVVIVIVRKRKLFDPYDCSCDAYNAACFRWCLRLRLSIDTGF